MSDKEMEEEVEGGVLSVLLSIAVETFTSPLNIVLLLVIAYFVYILYFSKKRTSPVPVSLPPMKKQDMTPQELRKYDGKNEDGRVCLAVNGKVFDVTKGKRYYGPGGPYQAFAGRDATRGLATFSVEVAEDYDDLSDLNSMQMESVREWEMQFKEKYQYVGRLLKPGEEATDYSDEEENSAEKDNKKSN